MARTKKQDVVKVTYTELLVKAFDAYDREIREWESKRDGRPDVDAAVDHMTEIPKQKLKLISKMYEIEIGQPLLED